MGERGSLPGTGLCGSNVTEKWPLQGAGLSGQGGQGTWHSDNGEGSAEAWKRRNSNITSGQMPKTKFQLQYFFQDGNRYQNVQGRNTGDIKGTFGACIGHSNSPVRGSKLMLLICVSCCLSEWIKCYFPPFWPQLIIENGTCQETSRSKPSSTLPQSQFWDMSSATQPVVLTQNHCWNSLWTRQTSHSLSAHSSGKLTPAPRDKAPGTGWSNTQRRQAHSPAAPPACAPPPRAFLRPPPQPLALPLLSASGKGRAPVSVCLSLQGQQGKDHTGIWGAFFKKVEVVLVKRWFRGFTEDRNWNEVLPVQKRGWIEIGGVGHICPIFRQRRRYKLHYSTISWKVTGVFRQGDSLKKERLLDFLWLIIKILLTKIF